MEGATSQLAGPDSGEMRGCHRPVCVQMVVGPSTILWWRVGQTTTTLSLDDDLNIVKCNTLMNINDIQIIHVYTDSNITVNKMLFIYFYYVVII